MICPIQGERVDLPRPTGCTTFSYNATDKFFSPYVVFPLFSCCNTYV